MSPLMPPRGFRTPWVSILFPQRPNNYEGGTLPAALMILPGLKSRQLFFARYFSWQPPQLSLANAPQVAFNESRSLTLPSASFAAEPNFANRASKSALFSQIAGSAGVSPPVF